MAKDLDRREAEWDPLLCRGVPFAQETRLPPAKEVAYDFGSLPPTADDNVVIRGTVGTDGSLMHPTPAKARRSGWSVVSVDASGALKVAIYGTCPDRVPSSHRAELWDIREAVRRALFPLCDKNGLF